MSDLHEAATELTVEKYEAEVLRLAREYQRLTDPTPIDEGWLRSVGFKDWDCADGDEYTLWHPANSELSWKCRLAWIANGMYVVRMCDPDDSEYDGVSESVELFDSRNSVKVVTRGQLRMLATALQIELKEPQ